MDRVGVTAILKYLRSAYRSFVINDNEIDAVITTWQDILQDIPNEVAYATVRNLCRVRPKFAPDPADIYLACTEHKAEMTIYQAQRLEQEQRVLELQEYHETEKVGPPPDFIQKKIDAIYRTKVKTDES
ncbi:MULTISPECIES: replicative helicase loader/inhibitor [Paenibacillus]|uniref:replicative helicase loader/inhibitor n=1 Tax=Paenibacillus TaxID=44249 RepID=UPI0009D72B3F|nr:MULTISPECIES: replicative helicase loader/inhibitor [Paenibacillus]